MAEAPTDVLQPAENVSLREILQGVTKILPRVFEVVLTAVIVVVVVAIDAMVVVMVMVVTNCVAHRSFSSLLRGARACFMPTLVGPCCICVEAAGRVQNLTHL